MGNQISGCESVKNDCQLIAGVEACVECMAWTWVKVCESMVFPSFRVI